MNALRIVLRILAAWFLLDLIICSLWARRVWGIR
jgi:hypothetical protein